MTEFTLRLEGNPGASLVHCAKGIANTLNVAVVFEFNTVQCVAVPGGTSDSIVRMYDAVVEGRRGLPR